MAVRAIRGAVQVDANERADILDGTTELVSEGVIDLDEALHRVNGDQLAQLMFPAFDLSGDPSPIAKGIPAVVILDPDGQTISSTGGGELANARTATAGEILTMLKQWSGSN